MKPLAPFPLLILFGLILTTLLILTEQTTGRPPASEVPARYVKVEIHTVDQRVFLDEIVVNPAR